MRKSRLSKRAIELRKSYGEDFYPLLEEKGIPEPKGVVSRIIRGGNILNKTLVHLANIFDVIPIVFYDKKGNVEDLGYDGFILGREVEKYWGRVIKKYIKKSKYSEEDVADHLNIGRLTVFHYTGGRIIPSYNQCEKLHNLLKMNRKYLVEKGVPALDNLQRALNLFDEYLFSPNIDIKTLEKAIVYGKQIEVQTKGLEAKVEALRRQQS